MCGISWQPRESRTAPRASAVRKIYHADGEWVARLFAPDQSTKDCDAFAGRVPTRLGARVRSHGGLARLFGKASACTSYCAAGTWRTCCDVWYKTCVHVSKMDSEWILKIWTGRACTSLECWVGRTATFRPQPRQVGISSHYISISLTRLYRHTRPRNIIHDITVGLFLCFFLVSYLYCHHESPNLSTNSLAYSVGTSWEHVLWPCLCECVHVFQMDSL